MEAASQLKNLLAADFLELAASNLSATCYRVRMGNSNWAQMLGDWRCKRGIDSPKSFCEKNCFRARGKFERKIYEWL
jgi:hypothetical protein